MADEGPDIPNFKCPVVNVLTGGQRSEDALRYLAQKRVILELEKYLHEGYSEAEAIQLSIDAREENTGDQLGLVIEKIKKK